MPHHCPPEESEKGGEHLPTSSCSHCLSHFKVCAGAKADQGSQGGRTPGAEVRGKEVRLERGVARLQTAARSCSNSESKSGPGCQVGTRDTQCTYIVRGQCEIAFKNLNKPVL